MSLRLGPDLGAQSGSPYDAPSELVMLDHSITSLLPALATDIDGERVPRCQRDDRRDACAPPTAAVPELHVAPCAPESLILDFVGDVVGGAIELVGVVT